MNLSIPDAAAELAVSESRLRRTLEAASVPTHVEFRQTRTGVRQTTVLDAGAIAQLRGRFAVQGTVGSRQPAIAIPQADAWEDDPERSAGSDQTCETAAAADHGADAWSASDGPERAGQCATFGQSVPVAQFNALLFQHNVLRQEFSRVTEYLDGCDVLLGEMVRTIASLEERTQRLDPGLARPSRLANPLAGALRSVSAGFQNAVIARGLAKQTAKPAPLFFGRAMAGQ